MSLFLGNTLKGHDVSNYSQMIQILRVGDAVFIIGGIIGGQIHRG